MNGATIETWLIFFGFIILIFILITSLSVFFVNRSKEKHETRETFFGMAGKILSCIFEGIMEGL